MSAWVRLEATAKGAGLGLLWHRRGLGKGEADRSGTYRELRNAKADGIAPVGAWTDVQGVDYADSLLSVVAFRRRFDERFAIRILSLIDTCLSTSVKP